MIWTIRIHVQSCSIPEPNVRRLETPCKSNAIMKIASAYALVVRSVDELNGEQISVQNMKGVDRRTRSKRAWFFDFGLQELRIFTKHRWLPHRMNASTMAPRRIWPARRSARSRLQGGEERRTNKGIQYSFVRIRASDSIAPRGHIYKLNIAFVSFKACSANKVVVTRIEECKLHIHQLAPR